MEIGQIRQGDVLLVPVDAMPPTKNVSKSITLAEGELTGHSHKLSSRNGVVDWEDPHLGRMVWVVGPEPGELQHEDHDPVPAPVVAPEQAYRVVIQREYSLEGMWRQVAD